MVSENLSIQDVGTGELLNVSLLLVLGIIIAIVANFFIKKLANVTIYPWIRKSHPDLYKRAVSGVNLTATVIQWIIIILFLFQILSIFHIYLLEEILAASINFLPKVAIAFLIVIVGLIITSILSRKISDLDFKHSALLSKFFQQYL